MLGNNYNVAYDEDVLNSSIRKVFLWMIVGLSLTIGTMFAVVGNESLASFVFSSWRILIFAELGLVIALSAAIRKISSAVAGIMFLLYSVMTGLTLSFTLFLYDYKFISDSTNRMNVKNEIMILNDIYETYEEEFIIYDLEKI